jgi:DNA polymerase-4
VAPNKFLAKIASGWRKPDGLTVIAPERVEHFLAQLPIDALWGVGPVTAKKLRAAGMERLLDVRSRSEEDLTQLVGSFGRMLMRLAYGQDDRLVEPHRERKSVGSETTYPSDLLDKVRSVTLTTLDGLSDADLDKPVTGPMKDFAPKWGAMFLLVGNHIMMHAAQLTVLRRKLGKPVLF